MTKKNSLLVFFFWLALMLIVIASVSCANYSNIKRIETTTTNVDGSVVVLLEECETKISSMREFKSGDLKIGKKCTINSGATDVKMNENVYGVLNSLVGKIP